MPTVTLRRASSADLHWLELWDDDPDVIACSSDDPQATSAFEGIDWAHELATQSDVYSRISSPRSTAGRSAPMQHLRPALRADALLGKDRAELARNGHLDRRCRGSRQRLRQRR